MQVTLPPFYFKKRRELKSKEITHKFWGLLLPSTKFCYQTMKILSSWGCRPQMLPVLLIPASMLYSFSHSYTDPSLSVGGRAGTGMQGDKVGSTSAPSACTLNQSSSETLKWLTSLSTTRISPSIQLAYSIMPSISWDPLDPLSYFPIHSLLSFFVSNPA